MPGRAADEKARIGLQVSAEVKARLVRAAAARHTDLGSFVTQAALREANAVIAETDQIRLSERDSRLVHDLLDTPRPLNKRMREAIAAMPKPR